jgi:hypothetical protein
LLRLLDSCNPCWKSAEPWPPENAEQKNLARASPKGHSREDSPCCPPDQRRNRRRDEVPENLLFLVAFGSRDNEHSARISR